MKNKLPYGLFILAVFSLIIFSVSCYTTFNHPPVYYQADSTDYYYTEEISLIDDCSQCHDQETTYIESNSVIYDDPVYEEKYEWNYFFVTPWWYNESYYADEQTPQQEEEIIRPPARHFTRQAGEQAPRYGTPSSSQPSLAKPSSGATSNSKPRPVKRNVRRQADPKPKKVSTPPPKRESNKKTSPKKKQNKKSS